MVLSTAEVRIVADTLDTMTRAEPTEGALRTAITAAIGRDPFEG